MYDVLHDSKYRKEWDPAMLESFDIARLSANADVGYYSCELQTSFICFIYLFIFFQICAVDHVSSVDAPVGLTSVTHLRHKHWGKKCLRGVLF